MLPGLSHLMEDGVLQAVTAIVPLRPVGVQRQRIIGHPLGSLPLLPDQGTELAMFHRGVAHQNPVPRVDGRTLRLGMGVTGGITQLQPFPHHTHAPANLQIHLADVLAVIAPQQGCQVNGALSHGKPFLLPPRQRRTTTGRIVVILDGLSQIVPQSNVHHILGVVDVHPHFICLRPGIEQMIVPAIVALQPGVAPVGLLCLLNQIEQYRRLQRLHIPQLRSVNVTDQKIPPFMLYPFKNQAPQGALSFLGSLFHDK